MKIVSDFDGVLTEQTEEALRVQELFRQEALRACGSSIYGFIDQAKLEMKSKPSLHGWRSRGRVTAFAEEDLFIWNNGLGAALDEMTPARERLTGSGYQSFSDLAQWAYQTMTNETRRGAMKPVDPQTRSVITDLVNHGHEVTIVSNSAPDRIIKLLNDAGLSANEHGSHDTFSGTSSVRVRGGAGKFSLSENKNGFAIGSFWIDISRPIYEKMLREECPRVVIGDVFTLDLALPLYLARSEPSTFGGMKLILRKRHYTPSWVLEFFSAAKEPNASLHAIENLSEILDLLHH